MRLLSGGGAVDNGGAHLSVSAPLGEGWSVSAVGDGLNTVTITAFANCLSAKVQKPTT
jgi:hypothetical protein